MAKLGVGLAFANLKPAEAIRSEVERYREAWAEEQGGEPPQPFLQTIVFVDESADRALELADRYGEASYHVSLEHYAMAADDFGTAKGYEWYREFRVVPGTEFARAPDHYAKKTIYGTPDQVLERFDGHGERLPLALAAGAGDQAGLHAPRRDDRAAPRRDLPARRGRARDDAPRAGRRVRGRRLRPLPRHARRRPLDRRPRRDEHADRDRELVPGLGSRALPRRARADLPAEGRPAGPAVRVPGVRHGRDGRAGDEGRVARALGRGGAGAPRRGVGARDERAARAGVRRAALRRP